MKQSFYLMLFSLVVQGTAFSQQHVGVGTNTPGFPLDINGRVRIRHNTNQSAGIWFDHPTNLTGSFIGAVNDSTWGVYDNTFNGSWKFNMDFKNNHLGIGANPVHPVTLGSELGDKISLWGGDIGLPGGVHYGLGIQSSQLQIFVPSDADNIVFGTGRSIAFNEKVRITGTGRLGIGITTPTHPLDVNGIVRLRGNGAAAGKVLTSSNELGVAIWADAVTSKSYRGNRSATTTFSSGSVVNFLFNQDFNDIGITNSGIPYVVPAGGGVFEITMQVTVTLSNAFSGTGMLQLDLVKNPGPGSSYIARTYEPLVYSSTNNKRVISITTLAKFAGGDNIIFYLSQNTGVDQTLTGLEGETFITITKLY